MNATEDNEDETVGFLNDNGSAAGGAPRIVLQRQVHTYTGCPVCSSPWVELG